MRPRVSDRADFRFVPLGAAGVALLLLPVWATETVGRDDLDARIHAHSSPKTTVWYDEAAPGFDDDEDGPAVEIGGAIVPSILCFLDIAFTETIITGRDAETMVLPAVLAFAPKLGPPVTSPLV